MRIDRINRAIIWIMAFATMTGTENVLQAQKGLHEEMVIKSGQVKQSVVGFGASLAYYENWLNAHPKKELIYHTIFGELSLDILRVRNAYVYDSGMVGRVKEYMEEAEAVRGYPIPLLSTSWGPTDTLKNTGDRTNGGTLRYTTGPGGVEFDYTGFANWWAGSLDEYNANGIYPTYISIQNEPSWTASWETCILKPTEIINSTDTIAGYNKALDAVYDTLVKRDHMPLILGPETSGIGSNSVENYINALDLSKIDAIVHHLYNGVDEDNPYASANFSKVGDFHPEIPHFQTEYDKGDWFSMAGHIYKSFHDENVQAYLYWGLIWDEEGEGLVILENPWNSGGWNSFNGFIKTKEFYAFKQFSAFIEPGWKRVDLDLTGDIPRALAFVSSDMDSMVCVVINRSDTENLSIRMGIDQYRITGSYVYETSDTRDCEKISRVRDSILTVPPHSINTVEMEITPYNPLDDTVAPTIPEKILITGTSATSISVAWDPSTDSMGVDSYRVYLDRILNGTTRETGYTLRELESNTIYMVSVTALDDAGNESEMSLPVIVTTDYIDNEPPLLTATDSVYQEGMVEAVSSEDGMIYLVPGGTGRWLSLILEASIDSVTAYADSAAKIMISGLENGLYWLYAIDSAFNISYPEVVSVLGVGVENTMVRYFNVYPNPMSGQTIIQFTLEEEQRMWVTVYDSQGREIRKESLGVRSAGSQHYILQRNGLQDGLYFLNLANSDGEGPSGRLIIRD